MRLARLVAVLSLSLAACGTESGTFTPSPDLAPARDLAVAPDLATTPPDMTEIVGCGDALACVQGCGQNQACAQDCLDEINSDDGPQLFAEWESCLNSASSTTCKASCPNPMAPDQACATCVFQACTPKQQACAADRG